MNSQPQKALNQGSKTEPNLLDLMVITWGFILLTFSSAEVFRKLFGPERFLLIGLLQLGFLTIYLRLRRLSLTRNLRWKKMRHRSLLPLFAVTIGSMVLLDEIDRLSLLIFHPPAEYFSRLAELYTSDTHLGTFLIIIAVSILGSLSEESVFRGFMLRYFENRMNITNSILWTSLFFAFIHLQPWLYIQLLSMSVICGYLTWRCDSIIPAFLVHSANNLWSLIFIGGYFPELEKHYLWYGYVHPIWFVVGLILFLRGFQLLQRVHAEK